MMRNTTSLLRKLIFSLGLLLCSGVALGQAFPVKPVRIIVPALPGGAIDIIARLLGERLTPAWGQTVLVENKPGGSQIIGTDLVAKSAPDGYNLVIVVSSHAVNPLLFKTLP